MASPEAKKGGHQQEERRRSSNSLNSSQNHQNGTSPGNQPQQQLQLRAPVIRHRDPEAPVTIRGWLFKQGSEGLQLWKKRWFVLSQFCLFYYHGPEEEKVLGSLLLPSYTIRPCLAGDKDRVYRKYAFKAEHRNTRSFYFAAESRQSMIQWMNALSLAAILQDNASLQQSATSPSSQVDLNASVASSSAHRRPSSSKAADASFDSDQPALTAGQRQPLYANAPPKPRRLNTSRDSPSCSSSPEQSPERRTAVMPPVPAGTAGHPHHKRLSNGGGRPASVEVATLLQQRPQSSHHQPQYNRNSPAGPQAQVIPAERRTPDAYGRFKLDYEEVYNNSSSSGSSSRLHAGQHNNGPTFVVAHRSEVARRVPPRPHSVDFLSLAQQQQQRGADYWASEENYAQQVRQSSAVRLSARDPAEISRDVKESALWSYVRQPAQQHQQQQRPAVSTPEAGQRNGHHPPEQQQQHRPVHRMLSTSQENLIDDSSRDVAADAQQQFHRSASARLPKVAKPSSQGAGQDQHLNNSSSNTSGGDPSEMDSRRMEQREESMKRLLEWKQRMLQSPLTRKGAAGGGAARSGSERSTPTMPQLAGGANGSSPGEDMSSPRLPSRIPPNQSSLDQSMAVPTGNLDHQQSTDYAVGNFVTLRRTMAQATQDLLHQERLYQHQQHQQQQQQQHQQNVAFRASLKRTPVGPDGKMKVLLDEEADVRKEFTYEYVLTTPGHHPSPDPSSRPLPPKVCWPANSSLVREKSSAVADLRARSESPSANRILFQNGGSKESLPSSSAGAPPLPAQLALAKSAGLAARPKPPPKPSLADLQQAFQLKYRANGLPLMMVMLEEDHHQTNNNPSLSGSDAGGQGSRLSYAESLPESLAGFAASIVSEEGGGSGTGLEGTISPPFEATVSPLTSECDWSHRGMNGGDHSSPAPLPDLMSLSSGRQAAQHQDQYENLYVNAGPEAGQELIQEDHYLPMATPKLAPRSSPPPLPAANRSHFEENAYVEMTDNGKMLRSGHRGLTTTSSVFAGVFDPSYRPAPESPRYSEISDMPTTSGSSSRMDQNKKDREEEDQPHYEFIYKASSHAEPVYMEVPQGEEEDARNGHHHHHTEEMETKAPDVHPSGMHSRQSSLSLSTTTEMMVAVPQTPCERTTEDPSEVRGELDDDLMVVPPRHPRFSISDTFRPASYFLQRLETIPSEDALQDETADQDSMDQDEQESMDSHNQPHFSSVPSSTAPSTPSTVHHHSRSQSLDQTVMTASPASVRAELSHRRRPLAVVRSLEDLLVDANEDQLAAMTLQSATQPAASTPAFRGSTQSLASSCRSGGGQATATWHQPLYENVSGAAHVRQASRHVRQASISSNHSTSRRISSASPTEQQPAAAASGQTPVQGHRQRLGSAVSLTSTVSNSSVCRSEQSMSSGAPYYYSDLLGGKVGQQGMAGRPPSRDETIVVLDDGSGSQNGSLRSSSSRSAQAQAAKQAYQHSMDRLRVARRSSSSSEQQQQQQQQTDWNQQTPTSSRQMYWPATNGNGNGSAGHQQEQYKRCQTPDLLAHQPDQQLNGSASTSRSGGEVMRRVRSLEGLLDDDVNEKGGQSPAVEQQQPANTTATTPEVRYARDPTRNPMRSGQESQQGDFSPWDEDQLWRDKLRRASIRHTRSMDMLDDLTSHSGGGGVGYRETPKKTPTKIPPPTHPPPPAPPTSTPPPSRPPDENGEDCYERLVQYSATLERTRRGQTYLDGYTWDEMEQRFRKPGSKIKSPVQSQPGQAAGGAAPGHGSSTAATVSSSSAASTLSSPSHHFLEDGLPPPAFEIDREKLRQWDLMSTAAPIPEGGRQPQHPRPASSSSAGVAAGLPSSSSSSSPRKSTVASIPPPPPKPGPPPPPAPPLSVIAQHACPASPPPPAPLAPAPPQQPSTDLPSTAGGTTSPVQAVAAGLTASSGPASKAMNGIKVAYHQSGLIKGPGGVGAHKFTSSLVTTQQPDRYVSESDMFRSKGKLPRMVGQDMRQPPEKVQLSAGDLLGRTHEELVLLLIQLRRQSSALLKARDACLLEMESQVKMASLDVSHRQECLMKTQELKHHVMELEKQLEKLKPLINLVDNMVKLGSSMSPRRGGGASVPAPPAANTAVKRNLAPLLHHQQQQQQMSPTYTNVQQQETPPAFHSTPLRNGSHPESSAYGVQQHHQRHFQPGWEEEQISELESKHHQLAQLEKFVREEGAAIQKLTRDQHVLRLAIRGVRQQTNAALQASDYGEVDRSRQQQLFLERELSGIHALLALSSKRLEDAAVEISRIEREISALHQQLHRGRGLSQPPSATSSPHHARSGSAAGAGREMVWLEGELNRVQQHVSQLQARRQELSSQVNRLTAAGYFLDLDDSFGNVAFSGPSSETAAGSANSKRKPISTWCETDLDSFSTVDRLGSPLYANSSGYGGQHPPPPQDRGGRKGDVFYYGDDDDDGMMPVDINEADERMKRYYGIMPKIPAPPPPPSQQNLMAGNDKEIRTVRIVKRESEKRARDKTSKRSPYDDLSYGSEEAEEEEERPPPVPPPPVDMNGTYGGNDPIMDDPVLSQFSHVLSLPGKRSSMSGSAKDLRRSSYSSQQQHQHQRNSIADLSGDSRSDQWRGSLRPRRNLSALSLGDRNSSVSLDMESTEEDGGLGSLESSTTTTATQRSPVLTPVYTSHAAREIVEEMRRQDMMSARRAVPRHKRRHITISCSQPLALEAVPTGLGQRGRARDDVDLQRALRYSQQHPFAPDVVRSTISQSIRINEKTIDRLLCAPDKILIPERYVPEQEVEELGEEEKQRRLKKTESIRRMLTDSATVDLPRPPSIAATGDVSLEPSEAKEMMAKERQERDRFIQLNQMLIEEMKEKSKMAAVHALAKMTSRREHGSSSEEDWSPPADPLPIYQQRYNYLT